MWNETLMYRLNFVVWRVRVVLSFLTLYFLWSAVLPQHTSLFHYSQSLMLTYIFGTALLGNLILSTRSGAVGDEIRSGDLSNFLVRPVNYFLLWFAKDAGDKAMNLLFSLVELTFIVAILRPPFFFQPHVFYLFFSLLAIISAVVIYFFLNVLIGICGFWVSEKIGRASCRERV